jgi:hypothetical protein
VGFRPFFCQAAPGALEGRRAQAPTARDSGFDFLGIELDAEHHRTASERLNLTTAQTVPPVTARPLSKAPTMRWPLPFTQYVSLDAQA